MNVTESSILYLIIPTLYTTNTTTSSTLSPFRPQHSPTTLTQIPSTSRSPLSTGNP